MSRIFKGKLGFLVRLVLSVGLIGGLVYYIGSADILAQMARVRWPIVALAVLVLASSVLVVTPRWTVILAALGYQIRWSALVGSVLLGSLFNQLLPTIVGGDVVRAWRARRLGVPLDAAINSVLIDRASGVLVSLVGAATLLPFAGPLRGQGSLRWIVAIATLVGLAGCVLFWGVARLGPLRTPLVGGIQRGVASLTKSISVLLATPRVALIVFLLACANQLLPVAAIWLLAGDLNVSMPLVDIALVTFVASLAATVPISLAGWGIREGALVFLLGLYDVQPETALAVSILFGASLTISATPGALMLLRRTAQPSAERRGPESPHP